MSMLKFLTSKTFFIQIGIAILVFLLLVFLTFQWLESYTNHEQRIEVPDLSKLELSQVDTKLKELDLRWEVIDSSKYNPDYPPYSVIDQAPRGGDFVKENRMIYLTLNPSNYPKIEIPDLITHTRRQVEATLVSMGFKIGDITYKPDMAKDAVLELRHKGELVEFGDRLKKTAVIDLVLGDGSLNYRSQISNPEPETVIEDEE
ncbi:MAG TPA: PASTA domain-containing protein [Flavobacteriaceae bacterium]|nr:PASTA domain-containing protein [Flavobacteriaceae bacterium]